METKQRLGYAPPQIYLVRPEPFLDGSSGYPRGIEVWTAPAPNLPPDAPHGPVNLPTLRAKPPQPVSDATANSTGISKADFEKLVQGEDAMLEDPESAPATAKTPVEPHKTASIDLSQQNSTKKEQNTQAQTGTNATSEQVNVPSTTTIPATTTTAVPKAATNPETAPPINGAIDLSQPNSSKTETKKPESNPQTVPTAKVNKTLAPVVTKKPSKPLIPEQSKEEKKNAPLAITPPVAPSQIPVQIASQAPPAPVIIEKKKDNYWWIIAAAVVGYIVLRKND